MGLKEPDTTEQLHFHFSLSCIGEGNGNPLQCYCLENPRDSGAWWAAVYGVAQSQTRLSNLAAAAAADCEYSVFQNEFIRYLVTTYCVSDTGLGTKHKARNIIEHISWWLSSKESTCNAGDTGDLISISGNGNPLQYSCLKIPWQEEPDGRGSQRARHS